MTTKQDHEPKFKPDEREVPVGDFEDALRQVLLAPRGKVRSENREPAKAELEVRHRLDRKD